MKKYLLFAAVALALSVFYAFVLPPSEAKMAKPSDYGLREGDLISAIFSDDPDVYIINEHGYKRLFLNPEIFNFYGHLGGFFSVKLVTPEVRDTFITSGLYRNCEENDPRVYGVEVDGEDTGKLRWVNVSANAAVSEDTEFFKKVFCINGQEFSWYPKSDDFKSVKEVPKYERHGKRGETTDVALNENRPLKDTGKVTVCHHPSEDASKPHEVVIAPEAVKAHLAHGDTLGVCPAATPTPSPTASPTSTPTVTPSPTTTPTPTVTPTPTPQPTPTSTPTPLPTPTPTPTPTPVSQAIVNDSFNSYTNGSIVGQGNWNSYANGGNFTVQGTTVFEGAKALYVNALADSVITKTGTSLSDGRQAVYVRTENRASWGPYGDGNAQIRILKGGWGGSAEFRNFLGVTFRSDGNVTYYDGGYQNFATYNDNEWTLVEFEWRSIDKKARYRVNAGIWTDWKPIAGGGTFTDFDTVGFDFYLPSGSGGAYFDALN